MRYFSKAPIDAAFAEESSRFRLDSSLRVFFLGAPSTGKTALFNKLNDPEHKLRERYSKTIGADFLVRYFGSNQEGAFQKIQLWDFQSEVKGLDMILNHYIAPSAFAGLQTPAVVFWCVDMSSEEKINESVSYINKLAASINPGIFPSKHYIIGTKIDAYKSQVSIDSLYFVSQLDIQNIFYCSVNYNLSIDALWAQLLSESLDSFAVNPVKPLLFVGHEHSGKTALLRRAGWGLYEDKYRCSIGTETYHVSLNQVKAPNTFECIVPSPVEVKTSLMNLYVRMAAGVLLCVSVDSNESAMAGVKYLELMFKKGLFDDEKFVAKRNEKPFIGENIFLIFTKSDNKPADFDWRDLKRRFEEKVNEAVKPMLFQFTHTFFCSAANNENIIEMFRVLQACYFSSPKIGEYFDKIKLNFKSTAFESETVTADQLPPPITESFGY